MKDINLPFQIGEQYEKWEFDLDTFVADKIRGYESYSFIKEISFYGLKPTQTELIFSLDILEAVILSFEPLEISYELRKTLVMQHKYSATQDLDSAPKIIICIVESTKSVYLLYGKRSIVLQLIPNLRNT